MVIVAGSINAAPIPSKNDHPINRIIGFVLKLAINVPTAKLIAPSTNTLFLPIMSMSLLVTNIKLAVINV